MKADQILSNKDRFYEFICNCVKYKVFAYYKSSSPDGPIEDQGIVFKNVLFGFTEESDDLISDSYCFIEITTENWNHAYPRPEPNGPKICVWENGFWASKEYQAALEPIMLSFFTNCLNIINAKIEEEKQKDLKKNEAFIVSQKRIFQEALAKLKES